MINYYQATKDYRLTNLASQLKTPTLVRIDINIPVINGKVVEDSFRLKAYASVLELMTEYAGLVVMSHQGRPGNPDFISLKQHWIILRKLLPTDIDIEFIPANKVFTEETRRKIKELNEREIILLDNTRMFKEEFNFNL